MALDLTRTENGPRGAAPAPPGHRAQPMGRFGRIDAVDVLSLYFALAFLLPGWLRIPNLGEAGRPSVLLGVALLGWWIVARVAPSLTPRSRQPLHFFVWLYLLVFLSAMVAGYQRGLTADEFTGMDRQVITFASMLGALLVAADGVRDRERLHALLRRIVLLATFPAFVGALQFIAEIDLSIKINFPGLEQGPIDWQRSRGGYVRSWGTSLHAIEFGVIMAMLTGVATHLALHARARIEAQLMWVLAFGFGAVGFFANSRTQMVALACVMGPLFLAWRARWRIRALIVGAIGLAAISMLAPGLISGLTDLFVNIDEDASAAAREEDYPIVLEQVSERPLLGVGPGTSGLGEEEVQDDAGILLDNEWLTALLTTGILGVAALALLFLAAMALARRVYRWGYDEEWRHLGQLLFGLILASAASSYLYDSFYYSQHTAMTFVAMGLAGAAYRINREGPLGAQRCPLGVVRRRRTLAWQPYRSTLAPERRGSAALDSYERAGGHIVDTYEDVDERRRTPTDRVHTNPIARRTLDDDAGVPALETSRNPIVRAVANDGD